MSCETATSPINIIPTNTTCYEKCKLTYKFKTGGISAKNESDHLSITPVDNGSTINYSATTSNTACGSSNGSGLHNYSIGEIKIYTPSFHTYNGQHVKGEFILHLNSITGPRNLLICIPIIETTHQSLSENAKQLTDIIKYMSPFQQGKESGIIADSNNFNLNNFIPKNVGYYSYTAKMPFEPCSNSCTDLIVYDIADVNSSIQLPTTAFDMLKEMIMESNFPIKSNDPDSHYAYNDKGATHGSDSAGSDEIYIDCQPTGSSGEVLIDKTKDSILNSDSFNILNSMSLKTVTKLSSVVTAILLIFSIILILGVLIYGVNRFILTKKSSGGTNTITLSSPRISNR